MAFMPANNANNPNTSNDNWKADGFINLYLPGKNGQRRKVGAVSLKLSKPGEKQLMEWFEADEKNVEVFVSKLIVEYNSMKDVDSAPFEL